SRAKAMRLPAGDQAGSPSCPGLLITRVTAVPGTPVAGASATKMSRLPPSRSLAKAMERPSGAQAGRAMAVAGPLTSRLGAEPSAPMTQIPGWPSRSLTNASLVPSGDQAGNPSFAVLLVSRVPSGDQAGRASKARGRLVSVWAALPSRLTAKTDAGTILGGVRLTLGPPSGTGGDVVVVVPELWWSTATARITTATATKNS